MKTIPTNSGPNLDLQPSRAAPASRPEAPDAASGRVWLLDPSRIGHLPACLRALGVPAAQERGEG